MPCSSFKGKVAAGEVRVPAAQAVAEQLGLAAGAKLPAVVTVCNGDLKLKQMYSGDMRGEALRRFVGARMGMGTCR